MGSDIERIRNSGAREDRFQGTGKWDSVSWRFI